MIHTSYLRKVLDPTEFISGIARAKEILKDVDFDAIAVTGYSGVSFGSALAYAMAKNLILVRKECDDSHAKYLGVEGTKEVKRWIFIDDFVVSGDTRTRVKARMMQFAPWAEMVGQYTFDAGVWRQTNEL